MRAAAQRLSAFLDGIRLALADDNKIGTNDIPGLRALAKGTGVPSANALVDAFSKVATGPVLVPRGRADGTGYAKRVVQFQPGEGAGFNADHLEAVLGRPEGLGAFQGSLDVVSLGRGGSITVELGRAVGKGLVVFGNPFLKPDGQPFSEPAKVEVSADLKHWYPLVGTADRTPVYANRTNMIPCSSPQAGGDRFLFADAGIPWGTTIRYVRVTDLGQGSNASPTGGFDLDAVYGF
jgi:hypothetical protein